MSGMAIEMIIDQSRRNPGSGVNVGGVLSYAERPRVGASLISHHTGPLDVTAINLSGVATTGLSGGSLT